MNEQAIRCPICHGLGECASEARRMRVGMNLWIERGCRACQGAGRTTTTRLIWYHANRQNDGRERQFFYERRKRQEREAA
jgi:DnaJ-class molecular chaperone